MVDGKYKKLGKVLKKLKQKHIPSIQEIEKENIELAKREKEFKKKFAAKGKWKQAKRKKKV